MKFVLALLASTALLTSGARADEVNPAQNTAVIDVAAPNLPGVKCVLRAEKGATQFRMGETIRLVASFTSDRPGYKIVRFERNDRGLATLGTVKVSPGENVVDPLGELPRPTGLFISGYVPEPLVLSAKPVDFPFALNDWARFDQPGVYQVTLTTARVFVAKPGDRRDAMSGIFNSDSVAPITSEPLQIEIVPADEAWANEQIEITRAFWRKQEISSPYAELKRPANDISFLGTRAAMTAILEHLGQGKQPRLRDDAYFYRTGFIGFADRPWLIDEMKRASERPDYAVTTGFFGLLNELQSLTNAPRPAGADATFVGSKKDAQGNDIKDARGRYLPATPTAAQQLQIGWETRLAAARLAARQSNWLRIAALTPTKTAAPRARTLSSLLELAWQSGLEKEPPIQAKLPQLVAQLAPVFDQLPADTRAGLLKYRWDKIKSPAFAPALQRTRQLPADKNDTDARQAADLALQRLAEIAPKVGRAQIIAQIKSPKPSVYFATLSSLPDATLPTLDDVLASNYEKSDSEISAQLIERYASAAILPRVKAHYATASERLGYLSLPAILAYFVRVNPGYGVPKVAEQLRLRGPQQYSVLLSSVAALQFDPLLEQLAIQSLNNAGEGAAIDAAQTLASYGSPAAEIALMKRLRNPAPAAYPKVRARIESRLVVALVNAQGWLCPPDQLRQIRELCQTDEGRRVADQYLRARSDGEPLSVNYSSGTDEYWSVDRYNGRGLENLRAKLMQFPRGSEFFWQSLGSDPKDDQAFETTKIWAAKRGLKIEPHQKIIARRKALGLS